MEAVTLVEWVVLAKWWLKLGAAVLFVWLLVMPAQATLLLDESLQGSTAGTRSGGTFVTGGWKVTGTFDCIYWHLPHAVSKGIAEFDVTGLNPNECRTGMEDKDELFHMYDYTYLNSDTDYSGYRDNPFKMFIRKQGCVAGKPDALENVWKVNNTPADCEIDSSVIGWTPCGGYRFRVEWGPDGSGNTYMKVYRNSVLLTTQSGTGTYLPGGHTVRIAASTRRDVMAGAPVDAIFSRVKVWDLNQVAAPTVTAPASGETVKTLTAFVQWTSDPHSAFQVRVNTSSSPETGVVWDSGQVTSDRDVIWTGTLVNLTSYYVFVRVASGSTWSGWSTGRSFTVDTSYASTPCTVRVVGSSLADNNGPFLGLGATYMQALRRCKYDRTRYQSDLAALAAKGFNYIRILSMVGWDGKEIAPLSFTNGAGHYVPAWTDYWQQFRDMIDIAYDQYGLRTEITVFADAQYCMPSSANQYSHLDGVLQNIVGRECKVILIEVANEYWQNGFSDPSGICTLRTYGKYLADRTSVPIALSSDSGGTNEAVAQMYMGSAADIATIHFSRDIGTSEGGWLPVRDCWRVGAIAGLAPVSSNEPIGNGSSVNTESDPLKLCSAAVFAYIAGLPMYVYHSNAGVAGDVRFEDTAGINAYQYVRQILPPEMSGWVRNDGIESAAPFTVYCNGQAGKYWPDVSGATSGCDRNIGAVKGSEFVCFPMGILGGGVQLQARRAMTFTYYNPLTGAVAGTLSKNSGDVFTLSQGPGAYIIKGRFVDVAQKALQIKPAAGAITIDGSAADWNLSEFTTPVRGGQSGTGDYAVVGYDGGTLYYGGYWTGGVLPTSAADHTARVYGRYDSSYVYFLVRCDDSDIRYPYATDMNWANDCVELYFDPSNDGGASPLSSSTSDVQLVIDANNQKNVYVCTDPYKAQVLAGVTSAVSRDSSGWWLEVRVAKSVLSPALTSSGCYGMDFNFRDNDANNDAAQTTVYTWSDPLSGSGFPSKIPDKWSDACFYTTVCFADSFDYPDGSLNGNDGWGGSATTQIAVENGSVKIVGGAGSYDAIHMITCDDQGTGVTGVRVRIKRGSGSTGIWSFWIDDTSSKNLARWFGNGTTARGRIASGSQVTGVQTLTGGWDDLYVRIDFNANTSQFFFNGTSLGTLSHAETGAGDSIGRIRLERTDSSSGSGQYVYLDDISVGLADAKAPSATIGAPSAPITKDGPVSYQVSFDEAVYGFNSSADVQVNSTGSAAAGSVSVTGSGPYTVTLSSITGSGTLGIGVKAASCVDSAGNSNAASAASATFAVVGADGSISSAKSSPTGTQVQLAGKVLYCLWPGFGYIEEPGRWSGVRLEGAVTGSEGDIVCLSGIVGDTSGGERRILVDAMSSYGTGQIGALGSSNISVESGPMRGLRVKAWGMVKSGSVTGNSFVITDGSDASGIKVMTQGAPGVSEGQFVTVTGAAGFDGGAVIYRTE